MKTLTRGGLVFLAAVFLLAGCQSVSCLGGKTSASSDPYSGFHSDDTVCDNGIVWGLNW